MSSNPPSHAPDNPAPARLYTDEPNDSSGTFAASSFTDDLQGKRCLLLQGPNGPFFRWLHDELVVCGALVTKVTLNAAEALYFLGRETVAYRGRQEDFPAFLQDLCSKQRFDVCFLFGDCRPYHQLARPVLDRWETEVLVFEDGYLRPDFITVEPSGVNGRSLLRTDPPRLADAAGVELVPPARVPGSFAWSVVHTIINSIGVTFGRPFYPHYRHHRDVNTIRQAALWGRSIYRHFMFKRKEAPILDELSGPLSKRFFLVALQVHNDSQITTSRFSDVRDFIEEVACSFAAHASASDWLVFKHHPADRAYRDYTSFIRALAARLGVVDRVRYVHDVHLPTLLKHAKGSLMVNSTLGWSSLHHGTPVLALGEAVYNYFGLNADCELDEFWTHQHVVDSTRVSRAETWLRLFNQANGSVWARIPGARPSGIFWPVRLRLGTGRVVDSTRRDVLPDETAGRTSLESGFPPAADESLEDVG